MVTSTIATSLPVIVALVSQQTLKNGRLKIQKNVFKSARTGKSATLTWLIKGVRSQKKGSLQHQKVVLIIEQSKMQQALSIEIAKKEKLQLVVLMNRESPAQHVWQLIEFEHW